MLVLSHHQTTPDVCQVDVVQSNMSRSDAFRADVFQFGLQRVSPMLQVNHYTRDGNIAPVDSATESSQAHNFINLRPSPICWCEFMNGLTKYSGEVQATILQPPVVTEF